MAETNEDIIKQNLNLYKGKELEIEGKYIQNNHIDKIFESLFQNDNKKILVTSVTGSGKTYSFLKNVQNNEIKTIFLAPYKSTTWQTFVSYEHENTVGFWGGKSVDLTGDETVIIATYDKSKQIRKQIDCSNFTLIIDEAHNLIGQYGFRKDAIKNINKLSNLVKNIIHITATPVGLSPKYDKIYNFRKEKNLKQAYISNSNKLTELISILIDNNQENHLDIIRINDKKKQKKIKDILVKEGLYSKDKILIFNSDVKGNDEFKNLINNEKINKKFSLLLTTSVIDDGVNLKNNNINNIYFFGSLDFNAIVQFPNRSRYGFNSMYVFNTHKEDRESFNIYSRFKYFYESSKEIRERYNAGIKFLGDPTNTDNKIVKEEIKYYKKAMTEILEPLFISFDKKNNEYFIDENKILLRVYQKLNGTLANHNILKNVLLNYAGFNNVETVNDLSTINYIEDEKEKYKKEFKSLINDEEICKYTAIKRLIHWSDVIVNDELEYSQDKVKKIENKYSSLNKIAKSQKIKVNKLARLYKILSKAKIDKDEIIDKVLKLYRDKVTPKTLKGKISFAIILNNDNLISKIEFNKIEKIIKLENSKFSNSELRKKLKSITDKYVKSPKIYLKNFFEVETKVIRDDEGTKRITIIKDRVELGNIYGIDFSNILESFDKTQLSEWTKEGISVLAA
ncbi:DEAD/DEAH box helicase family protein [Halanaerobium saccharolyticum]|uniref:DEAD/DEAH box helicase family protein n=1 Tax=Halanaerobium saccharolyticum TaxID=43595 RepID=UPI003FCD3CCF